MTQDILERQHYASLKAAIDLLVAEGRLRYDSLGQLLAGFPLSGWPPSLFLPAWMLLQGHRDWLAAQGIAARGLPTPPDLSAQSRFIARHPVEGFALFFAPRREISEAIKAIGAWEYVPEQPHWIVYPVQGVGKKVLGLAREHGFQLAEGVDSYAREIDLNPQPLVSRRILRATEMREGQFGFDVFFSKSAADVRAQIKDILGRAFVDWPEPHWWVPALPYQASDLLGIALRCQFSIDPPALPLLEELVEQASHLPPQPPVRRIEYDEAASCFWIYFPPDKQIKDEVGAIAGARFPTKDNSGRGWRVPGTGKALEGLVAFIDAHAEFVCLPRVKAQIRQQSARLAQRAQAATAKSAALSIEGLGGELRPRQLAAVAYAQEVGFRVLIGDEVGLGKTPEALAMLHVTSALPALILCQASLKYNWLDEVRRWLPGRTVSILEGEQSRPGDYAAEIMIINYDLLQPRLPALLAAFQQRGGLGAIIADESQLIKNRDAQRTQAALAVAEGVPVRLGLTGTPVLNRPIELASQLEFIGRLDDFGGWWAFVSRYCGARPTGHGWDFNGASNTEELHQLLKETCYIRRLKRDVMAELPPIQEEVVRIDIDNREEYQRAERDTIRWLREQVAQDQALLASLSGLPEDLRRQMLQERMRSKEERARRTLQLARIEALKQVAVRGKLAALHTWIDTFLSSGEKLVVFAVHIELQRILLGWYPDAARILGDMESEERFANVRRFQNDPACQLMVCAHKAAKEGNTLTAASNVALLELLWTPADIDQPIGRVHRETQKASSVTLWYLLAARTIEVTIARLIEAKRKVVNAVTDGAPLSPESQSVFEELLAILTQDPIEENRAAV
jgi:superfamily II DNA or RNA helicase